MPIDCNSFTRICTIITRVFAIGYAALAFFTFQEARDLARSNGYQYDSDEGIVYVPLLLCAPPSVESDGSSFIISSDSNCRGMKYLVSAPFVCSACSAFACLFFVIMDILARYEKGPFKMSAVAGMGSYLIIILIQAGITTGALVEQNIYWVNYMQEYLDGENFDATAKSYASTQILLGSAGFAFATAFLVLVDAILYRCNEKRQASIEAQKIADFIKAAKEAPSTPERDIKMSRTVDTVADGVENETDDDNNKANTDMPPWMSPV
mmetsp:Transcript_13834/g.32274  ORF Transcript_13834/g.32274 Transcript_13834/m.32274 type:complete len:266 (+) Transcript_13834:83-880(+)